MSDLAIVETCPCGAVYWVSGYALHVLDDVKKFRIAHAACRERETE